MTAAAGIQTFAWRPVGYMTMPASHWAKIYAPFDALDGFDEGIAAKEVLYIGRRELSKGQKEELDRKLARNSITGVVTEKSIAASLDTGKESLFLY